MDGEKIYSKYNMNEQILMKENEKFIDRVSDSIL